MPVAEECCVSPNNPSDNNVKSPEIRDKVINHDPCGPRYFPVRLKRQARPMRPPIESHLAAIRSVRTLSTSQTH